MVTRSVILVTPSEAAAFAATSTLSSSSSAADSIINNDAPFKQNSTEELQTNLFNYPSYSKPAQHTSPVGLVQLCNHKGCFHAVDFERRNGGLCYIHLNQKGPTDDGEHSDSEDEGKIRGVTAAKYCLDDEVGKKRDRPLEDSISNNKTKKRQRVDAFVIDLTDVPPQPPIPRSAGYIKEGASRYTGVSFDKRTNKWHAKIYIDGKERRIGSYENEEAAAVDYARAVVKYKGQGVLDNAREQRARDKVREQNSFIIDLSDVPPQPPIPKSEGRIKDGASKYTGVTFDKAMKKWKAQISIDGKRRCIGCFESEEKAAADYARAVLKYKGQGALDKARERRALDKAREQSSIIDIDLRDVPPQSPIPKCAGYIKEGASKYTGVYFNKLMNKWQAKIYIDGKNRLIGYYENEEEAAVDYSRAVFKYKNQSALGKAREQDSFIIDLSDVPPQPPIPKSSDYAIKEGASKYIGVTFNKQKNKWHAQIRIDGKPRWIGYYENEEAAAVDYARAVFKYKGQGALGRARKRKVLDEAMEQKSIRCSATITLGGRVKDGASKYKSLLASSVEIPPPARIFHHGSTCTYAS